jgi:pimeloyl-ACP methyl ester carboxylesterase
VARFVVDGVALEYEDSGIGDPVVCIHGVLIADSFRPLLLAFGQVDRYRLITYHRRGYVGSGRPRGPVSLAEQAADCAGLLSQLGLRRAHVVGHSFGGAVGLQLALDAPQLVHTLSLLEPGLLIGESADLYRQGLMDSARRYREAGAAVAVDEFLEMRWPGYRPALERLLPGALEQAVADASTCFETDLPAGLEWPFGEVQARRIRQPVLVVLGEKSVALHPRFAETYRLLLSWLPNAEGVIVPDAAHAVQMENPRATADALADFFARHPLDGSASSG